MRGTGSEADQQFVYEGSLAELCGGAPVRPGNRRGVDEPAAAPVVAGAAAPAPAPPPRDWYFLRACCVSDVSATNGLCFFALLARLGTPGHKLMDIVSFKKVAEDGAAGGGYVGFSRYDRFRGQLLEDLTRGAEYVNDALLDMYAAVARTDWACLLDCTASAVNAGTAANLQVHADEVVRRLSVPDARRGAAAPLAARAMAFVFVHGGHKTFAGCVGVRLVGSGATELMDGLLETLSARAVGGAPVEALRLHDCGGDYVTQEMLRPLLQDLDDDFAAADAQYLRLMKPKLSLEQLTLTLLLLRTRWPRLPVAVVGYGMVRRSLSIVAVDVQRRCQLAVTHLIQWATKAANAADVTQQARCQLARRRTHIRMLRLTSRARRRSLPRAVSAPQHHAVGLSRTPRLRAHPGAGARPRVADRRRRGCLQHMVCVALQGQRRAAQQARSHTRAAAAIAAPSLLALRPLSARACTGHQFVQGGDGA
jgi:hypothetical protein